MISKICGYTRLNPITKILGSLQGFKFTELKDPEHYFRFLRYHWRARQAIVTLEPDILPWGIESLCHCPHKWCVRPYRRSLRENQIFYTSLGLTKFSSELINEIPDAFERIDKLTPNPRHWKFLDARLATVLLMAGVKVHLHYHTLHFKFKDRPAPKSLLDI